MSQESIISLVIGGLIGWGISAWFYRRAYRDGEAATQQVLERIEAGVEQGQKGVNNIARMLERDMGARAAWDAKGNLTSLTFMTIQATTGDVTASIGMSARPRTEYDRQHEQPEGDRPTA